MTAVLLLCAYLLQTPGQPPSQNSPPPPEPYEGEWIVEVIDNIKVMPASRVTMTIRGGAIKGVASCNSYQGAFSVTDKGANVGQLLRTMKSCDGARMSEENDFFKVLQDVTGFDVRKDVLVLTTRGGKTLTARRTPRESQ